MSSTQFEVLKTNDLLQSTDNRSQSTWKIHPSLETLLGDFCSDFDVNKRMANQSIKYSSVGDSSITANGVKQANSPTCSPLSYRLSVSAPEFVPVTPDNVLKSFSRVDLGTNLFIPKKVPTPTPIEPQFVPLPSPKSENKYQSLKNEPHSRSRYNPEIHYPGRFSNEYGAPHQPEEQNLISFDADVPSLIKQSPPNVERFSSISYPGPVLSEDGESRVSSFDRSFTVPQNSELRPSGQNLFDKSVELPVFFQSGHDQLEANNFNSQKSVENNVPEVITHTANEENALREQPPAPVTQPSFKRPKFKTYAEAANYFYSLLEEQTREELFELPSVHLPSSPQAPHPPGSEHSFDRPNWAAARNEEPDLVKMRQQYCSVSSPPNSMTAREEYSPSTERAYKADHSKPILSPMICEQQVSPLHTGENGYTDPILHEPRPLHSRTNRLNSQPDGSQDFSCGVSADLSYPPYPYSNGGENQIKPYRKANNFAIRGESGSVDAQELEREIDEYHENLRAKANRANQFSSQRSKSSRNGGGGGRGKRGRHSFKRYSNEEQGFDDPVVSGGEVGWGMDNNANTQWGIESEMENGVGPY